MRRFYLHIRHHGIYYVEFVDPVTGGRLTARSTGTKIRDEALLLVAKWLDSGVPTGRQNQRKPRPLAIATGVDGFLKAIRKTDLNTDDAMRIVALLKERGLIDIPSVPGGKGKVQFNAFLEQFWDYEKSSYVREKLAHGQRIGKLFQCRASGYSAMRATPVLLNTGNRPSWAEPFQV